MTGVEIVLIVGTLTIAVGVWTTLAWLMWNKRQEDKQ
jgi:hypothetical protein